MIVSEQKGIQMSWHKWFVSDAESFKELTNEQMGKMFFAVMETVKTGEKVEVSDDIKLVYAIYIQKVFAAQVAYKNKCNKNAKSGQKGGLAKAENQRKRKEEQQNSEEEQAETTDEKNTFKFPSKTEFKNMAKHLVKTQESKFYYLPLTFDNYEITELYEEISERQEWKNLKIVSKTMLKNICYVFLADLEEGSNKYCRFLSAFYAYESRYKELLAKLNPDFVENYFDSDFSSFGIDDIDCVLESILKKDNTFSKDLNITLEKYFFEDHKELFKKEDLRF